MSNSTIVRRLAAVVAGIAVAAALAGAAQAATGRLSGMSRAEYRALMLRGQALDHRYGLDVRSAKPAGMTAAEYRALMLRSRALDRKYGLAPRTTPAVVAQPAPSTSGFAWSAFGIGAAAMLGFVLLAAGVLLGSRAGRDAEPVRVSS